VIHQSIALVYILPGDDIRLGKKRVPVRAGHAIRVWRSLPIGKQAPDQKSTHGNNETDDGCPL
jgi:hypothetical protein